jgi:DNA-binding response OmpR family regulator
MSTSQKETTRGLPATPWGFLPPRMRVLHIMTPRRAGAWLAEAFASDSACAVTLEEAMGAAAGLARLREVVFDAVLISHDPEELDALDLLDGLRAGGAEEPLIVLGQPSEQEMAALCYEVGADAYLCVNTATTRMLLWIVARATERHNLLRENRRLSSAERHRRHQENRETERLLTEQRDMIRDAEASQAAGPEPAELTGDERAAIGRRAAGEAEPAPLGDALEAHYRELLRAHVIMGSGNLSSEMAALAELLAAADVTAPQAMQLHVAVLEELVRGLGTRSARHVMTRADLLILEVLVHLAERYRLRSTPAPDDKQQPLEAR